MQIQFRRFGEAWQGAELMKAAQCWIQIKDADGEIRFVLPENVHPESLVKIRGQAPTPRTLAKAANV